MKDVWIDAKKIPMKDEVKNEVFQKLHKHMDLHQLKVVNHDKNLCGN